jgi:hypothetical protein
VVWARPLGRVQRVSPGRGCSTCQPGACLARWWRLHLGLRLHWSVGPSGQGVVWSRSLYKAWALQPGASHVNVRARIKSFSLQLGVYRSSACWWSQVSWAMGSKMMLSAWMRWRSRAAWSASGGRPLWEFDGGSGGWGRDGAIPGGDVPGGDSGSDGSQGCCPRARPWAIARPCGSVSVTDQRVLGCWDAAAARVLVSSGSRRPKAPAWAGVVDQPRRVPMGMMRLRLAGGGADWVGRSGPRRSPGSSGSPRRAFSASSALQADAPSGPA